MRLGRVILAMLAMCGLLAVLSACSSFQPSNAKANAPLSAEAKSRLVAIGSEPGAPMLVRIFKQSSELEIWKQSKNGEFKLFKTYEICAWSGGLGPKVVEGDRQSPEGIYSITPGLMNPNSNYYLAFNTGFPNKFDRAHGRTGSNLMVHGDCSSRGCYSMTDASIAEIYAMARETFIGGNKSFQLQIFPFRMTVANLSKVAKDPNIDFWQSIKPAYDRFELSKAPTNWDVCEGRYVIDVPEGMVLDAKGRCPQAVASLSPDLAAKAAADAVLIAEAALRLDKRAAQAATEAEKLAAAQAAAKVRGETISGFFGGLLGGIGGGEIDPSIDPVVPAPRPNRG